MEKKDLSIIHLSDAIKELSICITRFIKSEEFFNMGSDHQNEFFNTRRDMWAHLEYAEKSIQHFNDSLV